MTAQSRRNILKFGASLGGLTILSSCGGGSGSSVSEGPKKSFEIIQNGVIATDQFPLRLDALQNPTVVMLRAQESLDSLFLSGDSEFERFLKLKDWVARQWPHGNPDPYPPWNALIILEWARRPINPVYGFCAQYAQVMLQALLSLGYLARYIEVGLTYNPYAHFILEVWSNQYNKWIVMDPDYNVHFEADGIPLSAREVHNYYVSNQIGSVTTVRGEVVAGHPNPFDWPNGTLELYYYVRFFEKADQLSNPSNPFARYRDAVEWNDTLTVPWETSTVFSLYPKEVLTIQSTIKASEFEYKYNQVVLSIVSKSATSLNVTLNNNCYGFQNYFFEILNTSNVVLESGDIYSSSYGWVPLDDQATLKIYAVNSLGVRTYPAVINWL
jgi:hypothetical protein